jgi:hypothetical protein
LGVSQAWLNGDFVNSWGLIVDTIDIGLEYDDAYDLEEYERTTGTVFLKGNNGEWLRMEYVWGVGIVDDFSKIINCYNDNMSRSEGAYGSPGLIYVSAGLKK